MLSKKYREKKSIKKNIVQIKVLQKYFYFFIEKKFIKIDI
jgi:hypothetical protein